MIGKLTRLPLRQVWPHHREKRHSEGAASTCEREPYIV